MTSVMNAVTQTLAILLLVEERINQLDILNQIAAFIADNLVHVIETEVLLYNSLTLFFLTIHALRQEEGYILVAGWEFTQGMEYRHLLPDFNTVHVILELVQKALVRKPEQTDVGDLEQTHRQAFQPKPYSPATVVLHVTAYTENRQADLHWHTLGVELRHNQGAKHHDHN